MKKADKQTAGQPDYSTLSVPELLAELAAKDQLLSEKQQALNNKDHIIREQQQRIALVEEYLRLAKIQRYGARSETMRFQGDLFDEAELDVAMSDVADQLPDDEDVVRKRRFRTRHRGFSDDLPRLQIHLRLSDEEKQGATKNLLYQGQRRARCHPGTSPCTGILAGKGCL